MFAATLLLCAAPVLGADPLTVRDLAPFRRLDAAVLALPTPAPRTFASVAKGLLALAPSPLERARAAYVWTSTNLDYRADRARTATAALADLAGDCDAHAAVYAALCKALGVECATVGGSVRLALAPGKELAGFSKPLADGQWLVSHAWNAVRIDGRWGLVDATMGGKSSRNEAAPDDFFLVDPAVLATDHVPDDAAMLLAAAPRDLARAPLLRPAAWRMGIEPTALDADVRRDAARIVLRPRLAWQKGMRAALQTSTGSVPDRVLVQPSAEGTELFLAPPGSASIVWLGLGTGPSFRALAGYPLVGAAARQLPKAMTRFYESGASLVGPFEGDLEAGKPTEIRLRAPGAAQVVAFQGDGLAGRFVREGDAWVLRAAPAAGATLEVMASYENPRQFQGLLTYAVR